MGWPQFDSSKLFENLSKSGTIVFWIRLKKKVILKSRFIMFQSHRKRDICIMSDLQISAYFVGYGLKAFNNMCKTYDTMRNLAPFFGDVFGISAVFLFSLRLLKGVTSSKNAENPTEKGPVAQNQDLIRLRPSWNFVFGCTIKFLRTLAYSITRDVKWIRLLTDHELPKFLLPSSICCQECNDPPGEWIMPAKEQPEEACSRRYILYFHGGAFCLCGPETHRDLLARLVKDTGAHIFALRYRRPPEHPFPAALEDGLAAYAMLLRKADASRIVLAGDSAGGNLAVASILAGVSRQMPRPAGDGEPLLLPFSPFKAHRSH